MVLPFFGIPVGLAAVAIAAVLIACRAAAMGRLDPVA
jgi:hypothetical protein